MMGVVGNTNNAGHIARRRQLTRSKSQRGNHSVKSQGTDAGDREGRHRERRLSRAASQSTLFQPIEALQEPLPPQDAWIHSGRLRKRVVAQDISWQERLVVLTKDALFLSRMDARNVGESIPLLEVTAVVKQIATTESVSSEVTPICPICAVRVVNDSELLGSTAASIENQSRRRALSSISAEGTSKNFLRATSSGNLQAGVFEIFTSREGHFNGRTYAIRCASQRDCDEWISKIEGVRLEAGEREEAALKTTKLQELFVKVQGVCSAVYHHWAVQSIMAVLVVLNFIAAIAEAERVPEEDSNELNYFYYAEIFFTSAFALELLINMVGHWFKPFWEDEWNVFDFFIVLSSLVVIPLSDLPGFNILRLFRVFRIMRLFRWMKSLRVLIRALAASVVPVINAFAILSIITCLYAVVGVQLFGKKTPDRFDRFSTSFFTMIQVCTGDGWAEAVARPMWDDYKGPQVSVFFVTYILIAGTFLLNIVVAVLLDEFITSVEADKKLPAEEARLANEEEFFKNESPLDPLVSTLTRYTSSEDLDKQINDIFELLDPAAKGIITFKELQEGLRRLPFEPPIVLTADDFEEITHHHQLCKSSGKVDAATFTAIMRTQLRRFVQKYLNLKCMDGSQDNTWLILSLKQMLLNTHPGDQKQSREQEVRREERMERMLMELYDDMAQIKAALGVSYTAEPSPGPSVQPTPTASRFASFKSSFKHSLLDPDANGAQRSRRGSAESQERRPSTESQVSRISDSRLSETSLSSDLDAAGDGGGGKRRPPRLEQEHLSSQRSRGRKVMMAGGVNYNGEPPESVTKRLADPPLITDVLVSDAVRSADKERRTSCEISTPGVVVSLPDKADGPGTPAMHDSASILSGPPFDSAAQPHQQGENAAIVHPPTSNVNNPPSMPESAHNGSAADSQAGPAARAPDRDFVPIHRPHSSRPAGEASPMAKRRAMLQDLQGLEEEERSVDGAPAGNADGNAWPEVGLGSWKSQMLKEAWFDKQQSPVWAETNKRTQNRDPSSPSVSAQLVLDERGPGWA